MCSGSQYQMLTYHGKYPAQEASWRRVFDPYAPLLFNLYHYLEQNLQFGLVPENQFRVSRGRYSWTGSTPALFQEPFRAETLSSPSTHTYFLTQNSFLIDYYFLTHDCLLPHFPF